MSFVPLGLAGETGTLLSEAKKKQRDRASYLGCPLEPAGLVIEEVDAVMHWGVVDFLNGCIAPLSWAPDAVKGDRDGNGH
jgi:hypothetical protein